MAATDLSEQDKLIWLIAHTIHALGEGLRKAIEMNDEEYKLQVLQNTADTGRELLRTP